MYTQCPACKTVFGINEQIIEAADGMVCCSQCSHTYDARQTLMEELPEIPAAMRTIERAMLDEPAEGSTLSDAPAITAADVTLTGMTPPDDVQPAATTPATMAHEETDEDVPATAPEDEIPADVAADSITDEVIVAEPQASADRIPQQAAADATETLTTAAEETPDTTVDDIAEEDDLVALATRSFEHASVDEDTVTDTQSPDTTSAGNDDNPELPTTEDLSPDAAAFDQAAMQTPDTDTAVAADDTAAETGQPVDTETIDVAAAGEDIITADSGISDTEGNEEVATFDVTEAGTDSGIPDTEAPGEDTATTGDSETPGEKTSAEETPALDTDIHDQADVTDISAHTDEPAPIAEDSVTDEQQPVAASTEEPVLSDISGSDEESNATVDVDAHISAEEIEPVLDETGPENPEETPAVAAYEPAREEEPEPAAVTGTREDRLAARYLERVLGEREEENKHAYGWAFGIVLLIIVLSAQYAYLIRDNLAQSPNLRPWVEKLCEIAGCHLPLRRDLAKLKLIQQDVRSHPDKKNVLLINAVFVNTAAFPQAYPGLRFRLSDINERPIGERVFTPQEYLVKTVDTDAGMEPQVPVHAVFELIDPGKDAVNYEFDFK